MSSGILVESGNIFISFLFGSEQVIRIFNIFTITLRINTVVYPEFKVVPNVISNIIIDPSFTVDWWHSDMIMI
jgi:hypothetical protein